MRKVFVTFIFILTLCHCRAQGNPGEMTQQLEALAETRTTDNIEEEAEAIPERFRAHPVDLNTAGKALLLELQVLNELQIAALLSYRQLFGKLTDIHELQAVPSWDIQIIKTILPFVTVTMTRTLTAETVKRLQGGEHMILLRTEQDFSGVKQDDLKYKGSPLQLRIRYRYNYKGQLQYGFTGDKDAGEQFFKGAQRAGFDFYTAHFFIRNAGRIRSLALGDYTVNMGQGLICWQGMAMSKSADVSLIKRQSPVLKPFNSSGEFYFNRGAGITLQAGKFDITVFASGRKLSANRSSDTATGRIFFTSLLTSGYNRTAGEIADRNAVKQTTYGSSILFRQSRLNAAVNFIGHQFSLPFQKKSDPYNLYAIRGTQWYNASTDYSYTWRNMHLFGEAAMDKNLHTAFVQGMLISLHAKADLAFFYRHITPQYRSVAGNAFTENSEPVNENGLYTGISLRPGAGWKVDLYADIFTAPWLTYNADSPSGGASYLLQVKYTPGKQAELYTRFKAEQKSISGTSTDIQNADTGIRPKYNWRVHINYQFSQTTAIRCRAEAVWIGNKYSTREKGFLSFLDLLYKPLMAKHSAIARIQYFETDGYNTRIYAYENDVQYSYSIPAYAGNGYMYYLLLNRDFGKHLTCWIKVSHLFSLSPVQFTTADTAPAMPDKVHFSLQVRVLI